METMILVFQFLCVALLAAGTGFSIFHLMQQSTIADRFSYGAANDFETDFRRIARERR